MIYDHKKSLKLIETEINNWKSNTVIVIDTSGSMRNTDIWGSNDRLDAVWLSIALDFVATRLENGSSGNLDVISIVSMGTISEIILKNQPTTWVLYNEIVDIYNSIQKAYGHGFYMPSLDIAENLLNQNSNSSCALGLFFISDGRPSDFPLGNKIEKGTQLLCNRIGNLAKNFGRRLQFDAVGIGCASEFQHLESMVKTAEDQGAKSNLLLPSKTTSALGSVLHSFSTSLTETQTEMTEVDTNRQLYVKKVGRESKINANLKINEIENDK